MTLYVSPFGATVNLDFVIDDDGAELRAIVTGHSSGAMLRAVFTRSSFHEVARTSRECGFFRRRGLTILT